MKLMIDVDDQLFTVIAGAIMLARRAPKLLESQLCGGEGGEGLPPEVAEKLIGWGSTVKPMAFDDSAITDETEAGGQAYFDQRAAAALVQLMAEGGDPAALVKRLQTAARPPETP